MQLHLRCHDCGNLHLLLWGIIPSKIMAILVHHLHEQNSSPQTQFKYKKWSPSLLLNQCVFLDQMHFYRFHEEWEPHIFPWTWKRTQYQTSWPKKMKARLNMKLNYQFLSPNSSGQQKLNKAHNSCSTLIKTEKAALGKSYCICSKCSDDLCNVSREQGTENNGINNTFNSFCMGVPLITKR